MGWLRDSGLWSLSAGCEGGASASGDSSDEHGHGVACGVGPSETRREWDSVCPSRRERHAGRRATAVGERRLVCVSESEKGIGEEVGVESAGVRITR